MGMKDYLEGDVVVITLSGKLMGGDETTLFRGRVHEYINLNKRHFVIDLARVKWSSSDGLGMLITGLASAKKAGGDMVLASITNIRTLLVITRLVQVFDCYESVEEAMQGVRVTA